MTSLNALRAKATELAYILGDTETCADATFRRAYQLSRELGSAVGPALLEVLISRYRERHGTRIWGVSAAADVMGIHRRLAQKWRHR